jgi:signal transduction histidine kinase
MAPGTDLFWRRFRERLHDRRFWVVQSLVLVIAVAHTIIEGRGVLQNANDLYLVPIYFIPVLYAALNFGFEGALPTGLWCCLLTTPNIILVHRGAELIGVLAQLAFLVLLGSVVAIRVDKEQRAKLTAEDANRRLAEVQASLKRFIGLALGAQEEERSRLSRELHDETVQELVVAKTALENVRAGRGEPAQLELVEATLLRCIDGIRRFCRALRPSVLDDLVWCPHWNGCSLTWPTAVGSALSWRNKAIVCGSTPYRSLSSSESRRKRCTTSNTTHTRVGSWSVSPTIQAHFA